MTTSLPSMSFFDTELAPAAESITRTLICMPKLPRSRAAIRAPPYIPRKFSLGLSVDACSGRISVSLIAEGPAVVKAAAGAGFGAGAVTVFGAGAGAVFAVAAAFAGTVEGAGLDAAVLAAGAAAVVAAAALFELAAGAAVAELCCFSCCFWLLLPPGKRYHCADANIGIIHKIHSIVIVFFIS